MIAEYITFITVIAQVKHNETLPYIILTSLCHEIYCGLGVQGLG